MEAITPPYHRSEPKSRNKSSSRLNRIAADFAKENDDEYQSLSVSLDFVPTPKKASSPSAPLSLRSPNSLPLRDLLLLSPSPIRKSKTRLTDQIDMAEEPLEPVGMRKRRKSRGSQVGLTGCASPRMARRSRRRTELETRGDRDVGQAEEIVKPRKRRNSGKSKKEKLSLVLSVATPGESSKIEDEDGGNLEQIGMMISDLVMWKEVAKSSLWFGLGSLCFLSSCFAKGLNFSIFSAISQFALLILGLSFFSNSISQRNKAAKKCGFKLEEDDILRLAKVILPAINFTLSKTRALFSGEPSMTLKVAPLFLLGAEYGHLITLRRLCALGFFISFSIPKLYSCYSKQINQRGEYWKSCLLEAWSACSHKKIAAAVTFLTFWNLSSIKTRIFTVFLSLVIFRYLRQHMVQSLSHEARGDDKLEPGPEAAKEKVKQGKEKMEEGEEQKELQQAIVVAEPVYKS